MNRPVVFSQHVALLQKSKGAVETTPLASVIMPAFMAGDTLARSIISVQNQTICNWELLIVDDASQDHSFDIANGFARADNRIRLIGISKNGGAAQARNKAILQAQGRYIAFLDADDEWLPEKLARQIEFMKTRNAAFSFTGFYRQKGKKKRAVNVPEKVDYNRLLRGNIIGCLTAVYDRNLMGTRLMPDIRMRQDYALWLDLLKDTDYAYGLRDCLAIHHIKPGSLSSNRWHAAKATWNLYHKIEGNSPAKATWFLLQHLMQRLWA